MTGGYKPIVTELPDDGIEKHCRRLQGQKRMIGLQDKVRTTKNGFLLVRIVDGVPVRWDDVHLSIRDSKTIVL